MRFMVKMRNSVNNKLDRLLFHKQTKFALLFVPQAPQSSPRRILGDKRLRNEGIKLLN